MAETPVDDSASHTGDPLDPANAFQSSSLIDARTSHTGDPPDPANAFPSVSLELSGICSGNTNDSPRRSSIEDLPYLALMKIFGKLTIVEKLRTDPVSKTWQGFVTGSLQLETLFGVDGSQGKPTPRGYLQI